MHVILCLFGAPEDKVGDEVVSMSYSDFDMKEFLVGINLGQYLPNFQDFGYNNLQDCVGINNGVLQKIGISPTGHRRRILKQLETMFTKRQEKSGSVESQKTGDTENLGNSCSWTHCDGSDLHILNSSKARMKSWTSREWTKMDFGDDCIYEENSRLTDCESQEDKGNISLDLDFLSCQNMSTADNLVMGNVLKNVTPEKIPWAENSLEKGQPAAGHPHLDCALEETSSPSSAFSSSELKFGEDEQLTVWQLQNSPESLPVSPFIEFKGEMVDNDLYNRCAPNQTKTTPRPTRSFILRHRPVPEIPGSSPR